MDDIIKNLIIGLLIPVIKEITVEVIKKYMKEKQIDISSENLEYLRKIAEIETINRFTDKNLEVCMIHDSEKKG